MISTNGSIFRQFHLPLLIIIIFSASLSMSACAIKRAYSGPDLPSDKIAIIQPDLDKAFTEIRIKTIDEYRLAFYEDSVAVTPGNHKLTINVKLAFPYLDNSLSFTQNVSFNVDAGYIYTIRAKIDPVKNEGFLWVTSDKDSEEFVGGTKVGPIKLLTSKP